MSTPADQLEITPRPGGIEFNVKVVPGASRTKVAGFLGSALKLAVAAPPEAGKANAAVVELLSAVLGVKRADVEIITGHSQPQKRIAVRGMTAAQARSQLQ